MHAREGKDQERKTRGRKMPGPVAGLRFERESTPGPYFVPVFDPGGGQEPAKQPAPQVRERAPPRPPEAPSAGLGGAIARGFGWTALGLAINDALHYFAPAPRFELDRNLGGGLHIDVNTRGRDPIAYFYLMNADGGRQILDVEVTWDGGLVFSRQALEDTYRRLTRQPLPSGALTPLTQEQIWGVEEALRLRRSTTNNPTSPPSTLPPLPDAAVIPVSDDPELAAILEQPLTEEQAAGLASTMEARPLTREEEEEVLKKWDEGYHSAELIAHMLNLPIGSVKRFLAAYFHINGNKSAEEIAKLLDLSVPTVKALLSRMKAAPALTPEQELRVLALWGTQGVETFYDIAARMPGVAAESIRNFLIKHSYVDRNATPSEIASVLGIDRATVIQALITLRILPQFTLDQMSQAWTLWNLGKNGGETFEQIAARFPGVSAKSVRDHLEHRLASWVERIIGTRREIADMLGISEAAVRQILDAVVPLAARARPGPAQLSAEQEQEVLRLWMRNSDYREIAEEIARKFAIPPDEAKRLPLTIRNFLIERIYRNTDMTLAHIGHLVGQPSPLSGQTVRLILIQRGVYERGGRPGPRPRRREKRENSK
jgi:DNA-directed RNA polymerase specialized sigma24 family protein